MLGTKQIVLSVAGATTIIGGSAGVYLLSQDKTIKDRLNREGINLINTNDEYEISFKEFKSTQDYINLIKGNNSTLSTGSSLEEGGKALEKWCENNLKLSLSSTNIEKIIENTKKYCSKPPLTIEAKLTKGGKSLINNWSEKLGKLKVPADNGALLTDLKTIKKDLASLDVEEANKTLKEWCKAQIKTELTKDKNDDIWNKVSARCLQ